MNLFSIENVYQFQELNVGVLKWVFCYKEGILMETSVPCNFLSDSEYSVTKSDIIKKFDCNKMGTIARKPNIVAWKQQRHGSACAYCLEK